MTFLLDHLAAIVVGAILLGALAVFQQRSQASAVQAAQEYRQGSRAAELATLLERELENARGRSATEAAFALATGDAGVGAATYRFSLRRARTADGTEYTSQAAFPTVTDPEALSTSPVGLVVYHVEETGETARADGRDRPLLRATRYTFERGGPLRETGVYDGLLDLDVVALGAGGAETHEGEFTSTPRRLRFELVTAPAPTHDAASARHARTVRATAAGLHGAHGAPDLTVPGGLPALPGDGGAVPTDGGTAPTLDGSTLDPTGPTCSPTLDGGLAVVC